MTFKDLIGKTITEATVMKLAEYDDEGFLCLKFSDGTQAVIIADYGRFTGGSDDEYPTKIKIVDKYDRELIKKP
jgi:hypothetical protein